MDSTGDLVDGDGRYIRGMQGVRGGADEDGQMGIPATDQTIGKIRIPNTASSMSIGQDGTVYFVDTTRAGIQAIADAEVIFKPFEDDLKAAETAVKDAEDALALDPTLIDDVTDAKTALEEERILYEEQKAIFDSVKAANKATLQVAGQLQIATFSNTGGLDKVGGNLFRVSANSGDPTVGFALDQGFGKMESGFLEMSNVDLAEEFTDMIVAQRGFQANTRIITTSDEILQELVNLKR